MKSTILLTVAALSFASFSVFAEESNLTETFDSAELPKNWSSAKGTWTVADGQLKGAELAADKHTAVMTYKAPHTDSKVQFSFQLSGSPLFHLSFNHPKGHLFRAVVSETEVRINTDKDKKDPTSKAKILVKEKASFEQGKTYLMTCETKGDTFTVEIDDLKLEAKHERLTLPKTGYRLIVKGDGVIFDDFKILSRQ